MVVSLPVGLLWTVVFGNPSGAVTELSTRGSDIKQSFQHEHAPAFVSHLQGSNLVDHINTTNWAGAKLTKPHQGKTFNLVSAQFEIPEPALPHNSNDEHYAAAFWVGLGGYSSQPLLQAGVDVVLTRSGNKTKILVEPWWEWFPDFSHLLTPLEFACEVGYIVGIAVYAASPLFGIITFNNLSTGQQQCLGVKSPDDQKYRLIGDSVEWIVEHFRIEGKWQPLPDYGTIKFSNCVAGAAEERMGLNDATPIDGIGETSLDSYHVYSSSTIVNGSEFTVTYFPLK